MHEASAVFMAHFGKRLWPRIRYFFFAAVFFTAVAFVIISVT